MCYFDVILLSDVISSIGPKISDADTNDSKRVHFSFDDAILNVWHLMDSS